MKITYIAQASFIIENEDEMFCIDLWLNNPVYNLEMTDVPKMDYVFVTHDHRDHDMASGIEIAKRDGATFFSNSDIVTLASQKGVEKVERMGVGGTIKSGDLEVTQVHAEHTSDTGIPVGFIIKTGKFVIYHPGDTGYFKGLDFLAEIHKINVYMVPIGSRYTMGPIEASYAVNDIKPDYVIPMHYNTSPAVKQDPNYFKKLVNDKTPKTEVIIMEPGEEIEI